MAGETILVIDGGQDIDERMTTALEEENYLVYPVSSKEVNAEQAELLKPSLIYIKPLELSPTGLESCKAIHGIPSLKKVPIIILASLKKGPGPDDFRDYGIVDFLEPTFGPEELIEKTRTTLDKPLPSPSRSAKEDKPVASPKAASKNKKKRFALPGPTIPRSAIGIAILLIIAGAGFLAYKYFMPTQKVSSPPKGIAPVRVPSKTPEAGSESQLPPGKTVAETAAPAKPAPPSSPGAESKSQLPPAKDVAEKPISPTPLPAPSPGAESRSQLPPGRNVAETPKLATPVPPTPPGKPSAVSSESPSQSPRKPFYSVQIGAFKNEDIAQAFTKKFREKGYDAFIQPGVTKDKSRIYRVLVNKFEERKAAQKSVGEIQSKEGIEAVLYAE